MLASSPASMVNQKRPDLGIPNRFKLTSSRFRSVRSPAHCQIVPQPIMLVRIVSGDLLWIFLKLWALSQV